MKKQVRKAVINEIALKVLKNQDAVEQFLEAQQEMKPSRQLVRQTKHKTKKRYDDQDYN